MHLRNTFVILLLLVSTLSYGQDLKEMLKNQQNQTGTGPSSIINADGVQILTSFDQPTLGKSVSLEGALNTNTYIIGPNDIFTLGIYGYLNQLLPLTVSPEGSVLIPTVGEVKVSGLTLAEAKSRVVTAVKKRYYSSDVSFTLNTPRNFIVQVTGPVQGSYEVNAVTRASQILTTVFLDTLNYARVSDKGKEIEKRDIFLSQTSLRNIEILRKDGTIRKVDIYRYYITRDDKYNPYLLDGDVIKIPNIQINRNYITVEGAVQLGGSYEWAEGDNLETAIGLARGLDPEASEDSITVFRPYGYSDGFNTFTLNYRTDKDFAIQKYDRIFVNFKPGFTKNIRVLVLGEVKRPGYYPISLKNSNLKEVIQLAGGFTEKAFLPTSVVFRKYDAEYVENDTTEILINQRANDLLVTDRDFKNFDADIRAKRDRVVVDFEKLYNENDASQNIMLEAEDVIVINDDKNIVYVFGQVQNTGYVPFKEGADVDYYINRAGGFTLAAEEDEVRVIKFNSRGWYKPEDATIRSGDFVYVPKEVEKSFAETITTVAQVAGILGTIATLYLLFKADN